MLPGPIVGEDGFPLSIMRGGSGPALSPIVGVDEFPKPIVAADGFPLSIRGDAPVHKAPLDGLSAPALASLRAVWWTRQLLASYLDVIYDATHFYDQSGAGKTLTSSLPIDTTDEGSAVGLKLGGAAPTVLTRGDALGLAAEPDLTIVWKARSAPSGGPEDFPTLLNLGSAANPELIIYYTQGTDFAANDFVTIYNFDDNMGLTWHLPKGVLELLHKIVVIKPSAGLHADWTLSLNGGAPLAPTDVVPGAALALGGGLTLIGDFVDGGFPVDGALVGMLVAEGVLAGADLALVQAL